MPGAAHYSVEVPPPADGSTRARVGRLELTHGVVETPQFMPVGTNATVKALDPDEIAATGATIILANTYHLYLRPGHERIQRLFSITGLDEYFTFIRLIHSTYISTYITMLSHYLECGAHDFHVFLCTLTNYIY